MHFKKNWLIYLILVLTLIYLIGIAKNMPYFIGHPPTTQWMYDNIFSQDIIWPILTALAIVAWFSIFYFRKKHNRFKQIVYVSVLVLLNIGMLLSLINMTEGGLTNVYGIINSPNAAGYFTEAVRIKSASAFLADYHNLVPELEKHAKTHPPGAIVFAWKINNLLIGKEEFNKYIANRFMQDDDLGILTARKRTGLFVLSIIITLITALTTSSIYILSKSMYGHKNALVASTLWTLIPAPLLFYPSLDSMYAIFSALIIYFFYKTLNSKDITWPLLTGTVLAVSLFFTYSFLFFLVFFSLVYLFLLLRKDITVKPLIKKSLLIIAPIAIFYLILYFVYRFNSIQTFIQIIRMVIEDTASHKRPYLIWMFFNIFEFITFMGIPIAILFITKAYDSKEKKTIILSYIIAVLLFNVSGVVLGEAARIWIFLMPLFVVFAANRLNNSKSKTLIYMVFLLQILTTIFIKNFVRLVDI